MNVKLLRKIKKHILEEPNRLNMRTWGRHFDPPYRPKSFPVCGTTACIAGWAVVLKATTGTSVTNKLLLNAYIDGQKALELDSAQADRLFYLQDWPSQFKYGGSQRNKAKVTAARIEHFIKTKGAE